MPEYDIRAELDRMRSAGGEKEWFEFKVNNVGPNVLAENLSAVANMAAYVDEPYGYVTFGVRDGTHEIVGTSLREDNLPKIGNQNLQLWLSQMLNPQPELALFEIDIDNKKVLVFRIAAASGRPIDFQNIGFGRVGSNTVRLKEHLPHVASKLWSRFNNDAPFELRVAMADLSSTKVLELLDYDHYFKVSGNPKPSREDELLAIFRRSGVVKKIDDGQYSITNLGAITLARSLADFPALAERSPKIIIYEGPDKKASARELRGKFGYAVGLDNLVGSVQHFLPKKEVIELARRKTVELFPQIAVREFLANALIHQNFDIPGKRPTISIYSNRIEIENAGLPIIPIARFIDEDRQRNERLSGLMRELTYCEQRGSGIDKALFETMAAHLPPPQWLEGANTTTVVMKGPQPLSEMDHDDRIRACFYHCILQHTKREKMNNTTLRLLLGLNKNQYQTASRIISDAVEEGMIRPEKEGGSPRDRTYVPFWVR